MEQLERILVRHGFNLGLGMATVVLLVLGVLLMWRSPGPELPPTKKSAAKRPVADAGIGAAQRRKALLRVRQKGLIKQLMADAKRFDVPLKPARFFAPYPAYVTSGEWKLPARGGQLVTRELRISTQTRKLQAATDQMGRFDQKTILLTVENRSDRFVAYRVMTTPSGRIDCHGKAAMAQSAMVLGPRESTSRTECPIPDKDDSLTITRVEVVAITPLGHHYLSQLKPVSVGISPRTSAGHRVPPGHQICSGVSRQAIAQGYQKGQFGWVDVIDFFARYNCARHNFAGSYRRPGPAPVARTVDASRLAN